MHIRLRYESKKDKKVIKAELRHLHGVLESVKEQNPDLTVTIYS